MILARPAPTVPGAKARYLARSWVHFQLSMLDDQRAWYRTAHHPRWPKTFFLLSVGVPSDRLFGPDDYLATAMGIMRLLNEMMRMRFF